MYNEGHDPAHHVDTTHQMETDTTTIEREALLQAATKAAASGDQDAIRTARAQIQEHLEMYEADEGLSVLSEELGKLNAALGEETPTSVKYAERESQ